MKCFKVKKYTGREEIVEAESYVAEGNFVTFLKEPKNLTLKQKYWNKIKSINSKEVRRIELCDTEN